MNRRNRKSDAGGGIVLRLAANFFTLLVLSFIVTILVLARGIMGSP